MVSEIAGEVDAEGNALERISGKPVNANLLQVTRQ
jgi:hypothetical protein